MDEGTLKCGVGGIALTNKEHRAEVHYGFGLKSALPRLSSSSLIFSKNGEMRTVALLSTTLSRDLGSIELLVPVVTWEADRDHLLATSQDSAPLTREQRAMSLEVLLKHTPFADVHDLLAQFDAIPGATGTRLVMYLSLIHI